MTTAKKENYDVRAVSVVRRLASKEATTPIYNGLVSKDDMAWLYQHAGQLAVEVIEPVLGKKAPPVAISVEKISKKQLGHFKVGRDGLGLRWRIAMNVVHFSRPRADILSTLLHELLHATQLETPKATKAHHDKVFRDWTKEVGIPSDSRGVTLETIKDSPFDQYLIRHKVDGRAGLLTKKEVPKAKGSTLHKYSCPCGVNVRVGKGEFEATCNKCGGEFALNEGV